MKLIVSSCLIIAIIEAGCSFDPTGAGKLSKVTLITRHVVPVDIICKDEAREFVWVAHRGVGGEFSFVEEALPKEVLAGPEPGPGDGIECEYTSKIDLSTNGRN